MCEQSQDDCNDPGYSPAHSYFDLGALALRSGDYQEALRLLSLAEGEAENLGLGTKFLAQVRYKLAFVLNEQGWRYLAIDRLNLSRCTHESSDDCDLLCAQVSHLLGACYTKIGDYLNADSFLQKAHCLLRTSRLADIETYMSVIADFLNLKVECLQIAQCLRMELDSQGAQCLVTAWQTEMKGLEFAFSSLLNEANTLISDAGNAQPFSRASLLFGIAHAEFFRRFCAFPFVENQQPPCARTMKHYFSEAMEILIAHAGPEHPALIDWLNLQAECYLWNKHYADAEANLLRSISIAENSLGPASTRQLESMALLFQCDTYLMNPGLLDKCCRLIEMEARPYMQSSARQMFTTVSMSIHHFRISKCLTDEDIEEFWSARTAVLAAFCELDSDELIPPVSYPFSWVSRRTSSESVVRYEEHLAYCTVLEMFADWLGGRGRYEKQEQVLRQVVKLHLKVLSKGEFLDKSLLQLAHCLRTLKKDKDAEAIYSSLSLTNLKELHVDEEQLWLLDFDEQQQLCYLDFARYLRKRWRWKEAAIIQNRIKAINEAKEHHVTSKRSFLNDKSKETQLNIR